MADILITPTGSIFIAMTNLCNAVFFYPTRGRSVPYSEGLSIFKIKLNDYTLFQKILTLNQTVRVI